MYDLPISEVWELISNQEYLSQWLMPGNFKAEIGYSYTFNCKAENDCADGSVFGKVLEANAPYSLSFTWNSQALSQETTVTFSLEETAEGVRFSVLHTGFAIKDREAYEAHLKGWDFHLSETSKIQTLERP